MLSSDGADFRDAGGCRCGGELFAVRGVQTSTTSRHFQSSSRCEVALSQALFPKLRPAQGPLYRSYGMFDHDLVIRNANVIDGRGAAPFRADIAVDNGVISAVGQVHGRGEAEIDAGGRLV